MIRIYLMLGTIAVVVSAAAFAYKYVNDMQDQLLTLRENNVLLEQANVVNQETISQMEQDQARNQELVNNLQAELQVANQGVQQLRRVLADHDLTRLVIARPGLIETRINNATQDLFNQLRADTAQ